MSCGLPQSMYGRGELCCCSSNDILGDAPKRNGGMDVPPGVNMVDGDRENTDESLFRLSLGIEPGDIPFLFASLTLLGLLQVSSLLVSKSFLRRFFMGNWLGVPSAAVVGASSGGVVGVAGLSAFEPDELDRAAWRRLGEGVTADVEVLWQLSSAIASEGER